MPFSLQEILIHLIQQRLHLVLLTSYHFPYLKVLNHTLDIHLKSTADDWNLLIGLEPTPVNFVITPIERLLDTIVPDGFVEVVITVQYTI